MIVVFRHWEGEVIALFPTEPSDCRNWYNCDSYEHIGQHGGADPIWIVAHSRPAKPDEYRELARELRRIGYRLTIRKRIARHYNKTRQATWQRMRG